MDKRLKILFQLLDQKGEYRTAETLASELHVSTKTVRKLLKELGALLEGNGASIQKKYGAGYAVTVTDEENFRQFRKMIDEQMKGYLPSNSEERVQYLLESLFFNQGYLKMDDLSESLYISKRTLTSDLKEVERCLNEYGLELIRKPNHGIRVEGREFDLRRCMAATIGEASASRSPHFEKVTAGVSECLIHNDFAVPNVAFYSLILHIYVAVKRLRAGYPIPMNQEPHRTVKGYPEYRVAQDIAGFLSREFDLEFPEAEIVYIAIHLAGKKTITEGSVKDGSRPNLVITQEVSDLVTEMLELVYAAFKFDFRGDLELRMVLSQHIVPLLVRIRYNTMMKNPMVREVKEQFFLAFTMASQAAIVLNRSYHTVLTEDEIAYIAFAFALALERRKTEISRKNVLLVCGSGRGSAQLLLYRYKKEFGPYINEISVCDVSNLHKVDFTNIDYVFTTVPIRIPIPVPIQEVRYFLQSDDIGAVKQTLSREEMKEVTQYYEEELFLPHLHFGTKDEALEYLCRFLMEKKGLPEAFYESVREREKLAVTVFGNQVAMPHPLQAMSEGTFVCVGVLDEPVDWNGQPVQVIFLVSVANKNQASNELQSFYQMTAEFLLSPRHIQDLIRKRDYWWFVETMGRIQENMNG